MKFEPSLYKDTMRSLVASAHPSGDLLSQFGDPALFESAPHPKGAHAGLWLYFDCFDESHKISQDDPSSEGSFWHGIAHRREPDYWNSGYWFRKVGPHPIYPHLLAEVKALPDPNPPLKLSTRWDPFAFIDLCERAASDPKLVPYALNVQRIEWQLLFDYCRG